MRYNLDSSTISKLHNLKKDIISSNSNNNDVEDNSSDVEAQLINRANNKEKFSVQEQIQYMKQKGITFQHISEKKAESLLSSNTYYYKLSAYRKNFKKENGKYVNLDFGCLNELATLDMYLRYISLQLTLDLEHTLKTRLISTITEDHTEDGYTIVDEFDDYLLQKLMMDNPNFKANRYNSITKSVMNKIKNNDSYYLDLYQKYEKLPIWILLELMSYGQLIRFIEFYYEHDKFKKKDFLTAYSLLKYSKHFRDSAAHSRPLLFKITSKNELSSNELVTNYASQASIPKIKRKTYLSNTKLHDFICIIILHQSYIVSNEMKLNRKEQLLDFLDRCRKRASFFNENEELKNIFMLFSKIVDNYNIT